MNHAFVIAFRDRGADPLRKANLDFVLEYVELLGLGPIHLVDDGRAGIEQWNRHAAYNTGAHLAFQHADVATFYEADMLVPETQLITAIEWASQSPGLVVPFTERHEHNLQDSDRIRNGEVEPWSCTATVIKPKPRRTGAINVISRATYDLVGQYDPAFEGSWWDDRAMHLAFDMCTGPTRWVDGPSHHLFHLPGYTGGHLTPEDKQATTRNRRRFTRYERARTPEQIRYLTAGN